MLTEILLRIPCSVIRRCSLVPTSHWLQGKCARINLPSAAFGIILQNHRRPPVSIFSVKIAVLGSLKRVTGRIFKISKNFQRSKLKFGVWFFHQVKKIMKLSAHVQNFYHNKPSKKLFISWHSPFKQILGDKLQSVFFRKYSANIGEPALQSVSVKERVLFGMIYRRHIIHDRHLCACAL